MNEKMSDERLAWIRARPVTAAEEELLAEVDRLNAALARATDTERVYRAYREAQIGRALSDIEHDALRSRIEVQWLATALSSGAEPA